MDRQLRSKVLQLAMKMQATMNELYAMMNEYPELYKGMDRHKLGDADYRLGLLVTHLLRLTTN